MTGTTAMQAGRLEVESILRAPLVIVADPAVAASGPPATLDELAGRESALLERPAGTIVAVANRRAGSGLFVWAGRTFLAIIADPGEDTVLSPLGPLTVSSGRLVAGAPEVVSAWGADVDTGDGSPVRARMHRGRSRLGLIVVAHAPVGEAAVTVGDGAAAVSFPTALEKCPTMPLALAG